jgi:hypothetical protein
MTRITQRKKDFGFRPFYNAIRVFLLPFYLQCSLQFFLVKLSHHWSVAPYASYYSYSSSRCSFTIALQGKSKHHQWEATLPHGEGHYFGHRGTGQQDVGA